MMNLDYLTLPDIPDELIETIDIINNRPFTPDIPLNETKFKLKDVPAPLFDYLKSIFKMNIWARYQLVYCDLPKHVDGGNRKIAFNYLIESGGNNVHTTTYNAEGNLLNSTCVKLKQWHFLRTSLPHSVENVDSIRIAITVSVQNYNEQEINAFIERNTIH